MSKSKLLFLICLLMLALVGACPSDNNNFSIKTKIPKENSILLKDDQRYSSKSRSLQSFTEKLKPSLGLNYRIQGIPTVGEPLEIDVFVSSVVDNVPIQIDYRARQHGELYFIHNDRERASKIANVESREGHKIIVIPQREGFSRLIISAQLQMPGATITNSRTIPIQVGNNPVEKQKNGKLKKDENNEAILSMPAKH